MEALAKLLARDQIRQLAQRYALAIDERDLGTLVGLFVPDVDCGRFGRGRDALRESFASQLRETGPTVMQVANHVIDFEDADHARGVVTGIAEVSHPEGWIRQAIRYEDRYEQRQGSWLFVRRKHLLCYGVVLPYDPLKQEPAEWPQRQVGRGTVPWCLESWQKFEREKS